MNIDNTRQLALNLDQYKIDPHTGERFIPKRHNQIYASEKSKAAFNNAKAKERRESLAPILNPILQNIKVLEEIMHDKQEADFHFQFLLAKKFDLNINTGVYKNEDGKLYTSMGGFVLIKKDNENFKIKRI